MNIIRKEQAPQYERDGIRSYLLVSESTTGAKYITTTLVEMNPGGVQKPHSHKTEQCYTIIEGQGLMRVDDDKQIVNAGDTIFIPSNSLHGLENTGKEILRYLSAGSPVFGFKKEKELWPLNNMASS